MVVEPDFNAIDTQRDRLFSVAQTHMPQGMDRIRMAYAVAERAHMGQARDDGYPYVLHPVRTARILVEEMGEQDANSIAAALLHDVVEDTDVTLLEIETQFSPRIAQLVDSVTRPRAKDETEQDKLTTKPRNYEKILASPPETVRMKAADILDNMRSWVAAEAIVRAQGKLPRWLDEAHAWYFQIGEKAGHGVDEKMREIVRYFEE